MLRLNNKTTRARKAPANLYNVNLPILKPPNGTNSARKDELTVTNRALLRQNLHFKLKEHDKLIKKYKVERCIAI